MQIETITLEDDDILDSQESLLPTSQQVLEEPDDTQLLSELSTPINDDFLELETSSEPLDLNLEPEKKPSNNIWLRIVIITLGTGFFAFIGMGILMLFNGDSNSISQNNSTTSETKTETEDPLIAAQRESEQKTARLILLGDNPTDLTKSSSTQSPTSTATSAPPTTPTTTPTQSSITPTQSSTTAYSSSQRPISSNYSPPPSRSASISASDGVITPIIPANRNLPPNSSNIATLTQPQIADRETLTKKGWSGFSTENKENTSVISNQFNNDSNNDSNVASVREIKSNSPTSDTSTSDPSTSNPSTSDTSNPNQYPIIRLGDSREIPNSTQWNYYAQSKSNSLISSLSLKALENQNQPSNKPEFRANKTVFPVGTPLKARLETPIIYTEELKNKPRPFTLKLSQHLQDSQNRIVLPIDITFSGEVISVTSNGMVVAQITSISYRQNQQWKTLTIPPNAMVILADNRQPLMADVLNDPGGNIAAQDAFIGALGAAETGFEQINTPDTQISTNSGGFGFNSTTTNTARGNLATGLAQGLFSTLKGRLEQRAQQATENYANQKPIYLVKNETQVTILVNAILEIYQ